MKKHLALVLLLCLLLTALVGCSGTSNTPAPAAPAETAEPASEPAADAAPADEAPAAEPIHLNVGYNPDYCCAWVLTTAVNKGYFAEEGFDVTLYQFSNGPEQVAAMESGALDIVSIGTGAHKLAATGSCKIFCFSHLSDAERIMGLASHDVKTLEDLRGKKVGYASGTASETILVTALNSIGMTMDDIQAYDMDTNSIATAMISGDIDACATWSPNDLTIIDAVGDDAVILATSSDYTDVYVGPLSFAAANDFVANNHDLVVAFTRALYKAKDFASVDENRADVAKFVADQCGLDYDAVFAQRYDGAFISGKETYEYAKDGTLQAYYELYESSAVSGGTIEADKALPVAEFVDFSVMLDAGSELYG